MTVRSWAREERRSAISALLRDVVGTGEVNAPDVFDAGSSLPLVPRCEGPGAPQELLEDA